MFIQGAHSPARARYHDASHRGHRSTHDAAALRKMGGCPCTSICRATGDVRHSRRSSLYELHDAGVAERIPAAAYSRQKPRLESQ